MKLELGMEITAETIFKKVETGEVTSILENSVVIENANGRYVVKKIVLKQLGYKVSIPPAKKKKAPVVQ